MYNAEDFRVGTRQTVQNRNSTPMARPVQRNIQQIPVVFKNPLNESTQVGAVEGPVYQTQDWQNSVSATRPPLAYAGRKYQPTPSTMARPNPAPQQHYTEQYQQVEHEVQVNRRPPSRLPPGPMRIGYQGRADEEQKKGGNRGQKDKNNRGGNQDKNNKGGNQDKNNRGGNRGQKDKKDKGGNQGGNNQNPPKDGPKGNSPPKDNNCEAQITALFAPNSLSVVVSGTKDVSHVILKFCDGSSQKFDDPKCGQSGTFSGTGSYAGKCISSVVVKCGCTTATINNEHLAEGCCDDPHTPPDCTFGAPDCAGVCGGPHIYDCAGVCYDPNTEEPSATYDCKGICGGSNELDCAGQCYDPEKEDPPTVRDCAGVCGGNSVPDCKGVCGGSSVPDCAGVCGGDSTADCKGVCGGSATYDCKGICYDPETEDPPHTRDCKGVCDGNAYRDCHGKCISEECVWDGKPYAFNGKPAYARASSYQQNRNPVNNNRGRKMVFLGKNDI